MGLTKSFIAATLRIFRPGDIGVLSPACSLAAIPQPLPIAATIDLQGRLPPFQQTLLNPTIVISLVLLGLALICVVILSYRTRSLAKRAAYREALKTAERIILKRGGSLEDVDRVLYVFRTFPKLDPAAIVMLKDRYLTEMQPILERVFGINFGQRVQNLFYPPHQDTRRAYANQTKDVAALVEEQKTVTAGQTPANILTLMDATLKPGMICRLTFEGIEGGYQCLVMGHDLNSINVTLPAHNDQLVAQLNPGRRIEGTIESGPTLMAFTSAIIQAIAGSMPYCRMSAWKTAWEVRTRDSIRLPISLEIDFNHISTAASESIKMASLDKVLGTIRPGRLTDLSLGGCCIDTPSDAVFRVGDMVRFSKAMVSGNPPATLLGAIVNIMAIDPETNEGSRQSLHIQFLIIDDVSQRILVRTIRQLQDSSDRDEWMRAQQLLQLMRRNKIPNIGSPTGTTAPRFESTTVVKKSGTTTAQTSNRADSSQPTGPHRPPSSRGGPSR